MFPSDQAIFVANMARNTPSSAPRTLLPAHLREVCAILAIGLLRLRARTADDATGRTVEPDEDRDNSLHFQSDPSLYAALKTGRAA